MEEKGLLEGVVVLDLSRVLAGPYCGMLLADMGATVIKVENPDGGDDSRQLWPFVNEGSAYYVNYNRSKLGCTLNLRDPEAKEIFKEMVKKADIVIENYRPGTMEKLGLGYEVLKEVNPGIIYGSVSAFGHTGPYSKRAGYDIVAQAAAGLMSATGWPGGSPTRTGTPIGDVLSGLNLAVGILAALVNKRRTGLGEKVDIALADAVASAMTNTNMIYQATGQLPTRNGNRDPAAYPYDSFPAVDGDVIIAIANDKLFSILCDVMGRPELTQDPRFAENKDRVEYYQELREIVSDWSRQFTVDQLDQMLNGAGCPATPVNTVDRVMADPQIAGDRGMFPVIQQPGVGELAITATAQKLTRTKAYPRKPAPLLGEDNAAVFGQLLGFDEAKLTQLKEQGII